tara:strand:+ start:267 stop:719 length:453 start_codon:yes stop_codon:yes gene_type:complete
MRKFVILVATVLILNGCSYEPIFSNKKYDFQFNEIEAQGDYEINSIIKNNLKTQSSSSNYFDINFNTRKSKDIISLNTSGDPAIFKIKINVDFEIRQNQSVFLSNNLTREVTYNNIDDKFELLKYERNIIKSISDNISNEILMSVVEKYK